jgi:peptidoglycan L-alanyl-D-glutamate endopeptidase CwlK
MPAFGTASLSRLATCHEDLQRVMAEAIATSPVDFAIVAGHRGQAEQDRCCMEGKSKTPWPTSKHNHQPSLAVDVAPYVGGKIVWNDKELFRDLAHHIFATADRLGIRLRWGGNWSDNADEPPHSTFIDMPHFELRGL